MPGVGLPLLTKWKATKRVSNRLQLLTSYHFLYGFAGVIRENLPMKQNNPFVLLIEATGDVSKEHVIFTTVYQIYLLDYTFKAFESKSTSANSWEV